MVHEQGRDKFRSLLRHERERLFNYRSDWEGSLKRLQEPELEERAQKELISRDLESLDEQGTAVIEAIDRAPSQAGNRKLRRLRTLR